MSESAPKFKLAFALPTLTALVLAGCAVVGSAPTFDEAATFLGCHSTLGSYSLPKTIMQIQITKNKDQSFHVLQKLDPILVPDNQHTFCLDHLRSPLASDQVRVFKNKITADQTDTSEMVGTTALKKRVVTGIAPETTPFLQLIASRAVDHTAGIIRRIIRTAFILISNKGSFTPASRSAVGKNIGGNDIIVADFQVDPFDYQEMAQVNASVGKLGFCFVLEDYTFDRSNQTGVSANQYCGAPLKTALERPPYAAEAIRNLHYLAPKPRDGIFFRPRAGYRVSVYVKEDPNGRGTWRLGRINNMNMENIMPIVSVGVDRAIFATRRTGLVFSDGALTNVCISKGSEAEGAIQIPLDVIYGMIALPSETISAAISDANTTKDLAAARKRLIDGQNQYIKFLNRDKDVTAGSLEKGNTTKKGSLDLAAPTQTTPALPDDDPPDADPILGSADALSEICAELGVAKTADPTSSTSSTIKPGNF